MAVTVNRFAPSCLPRVAYIVGCFHVLGSLWNTTGAIFTLHATENMDPDYAAAYNYDAIITITVAAAFALVGFLLIAGTYLRSHLLLLPWLIIEGASLVIYFVFTSYNIFWMDFTTWNDEKTKQIAVAMVYFSIIGLCTYVWFAILQLYHQIKAENETPIADDQEKLVANPISIPTRAAKPYPPAYVIPITYTAAERPPSLIKY